MGHLILQALKLTEKARYRERSLQMPVKSQKLKKGHRDQMKLCGEEGA